jgi:hypothetical protein
VLLVNFTKGRLGQDNADLLGSMLLVILASAALCRGDIPESNCDSCTRSGAHRNERVAPLNRYRGESSSRAAQHTRLRRLEA